MSLIALEHHPENGHSPWVVVTNGKTRLWFAYQTRAQAEKKMAEEQFVEFVALLERAA